MSGYNPDKITDDIIEEFIDFLTDETDKRGRGCKEI